MLVPGLKRASAAGLMSDGRGQRAGGRRTGRRGRDGQRRRAAYAAVSCGDRDAGVRGDGRGVDAEGRTRGCPPPR